MSKTTVTRTFIGVGVAGDAADFTVGIARHRHREPCLVGIGRGWR